MDDDGSISLLPVEANSSTKLYQGWFVPWNVVLWPRVEVIMFHSMLFQVLRGI